MRSSDANKRHPALRPRIFLGAAFALAIAAGIPAGTREALRAGAQHVRFVLFGELGDNSIAGRGGWLFYRPAVRYAIEPWSLDRNDAPGNIVAAIASFRDDLAARGIRLLVIPAPNKSSIYPDRLTSRAYADGRAVPAATRQLLARLREVGVEVLDLFETFRAARSGGAGPDLYLVQDSHWSPAGVRLAARTAAERLAALGWIERRPSPFAVEPAAVARPGDLVRMIHAPSIERALGPEEIAAERIVEAAARAPYRDDPRSPVLVMGDSFLRIYADDEPGSAGFAAHLARELGFPVASIVMDGGGSTLLRQHLARNPAILAGRTAIVWEFVERDIRFGLEGWLPVPLPRP